MRTAELAGALLDYWVARAEGYGWSPDIQPQSARGVPAYSTDWAQGGPIIERDQIFLDPPQDVHYNGGLNHGWKRYDHWRATVSARTRTLPPKNEVQESLSARGVGRGAGETPLIAAMRAKVASHYGDEVPENDMAAAQRDAQGEKT